MSPGIDKQRQPDQGTRVSPLAGKSADPSVLVSLPRLVAAYYTERPDPSVPGHRVSFGTSGHRGSSFTCGFNESHVLAISQSIVHDLGGKLHTEVSPGGGGLQRLKLPQLVAVTAVTAAM